MTPLNIKTERYLDIDILEAQVAIDEEFDSWLTEFLGVRAAAELSPQAPPQLGAVQTPPDAELRSKVGGELPLPQVGEGEIGNAI